MSLPKGFTMSKERPNEGDKIPCTQYDHQHHLFFMNENTQKLKGHTIHNQPKKQKQESFKTKTLMLFSNQMDLLLGHTMSLHLTPKMLHDLLSRKCSLQLEQIICLCKRDR
jgi:hypothetical protein